MIIMVLANQFYLQWSTDTKQHKHQLQVTTNYANKVKPNDTIKDWFSIFYTI